MYANGKGVLKDDKQAASWYQKAAEQENAGAQYNLGNTCWLNLKLCTVSTKTAIFAGLTSGAMSCPKLKIGFVSPLN
jgi:TPR repeat protein